MGDMTVPSTVTRENRDEWITFVKLGDKRAGRTLIHQNDRSLLAVYKRMGWVRESEIEATENESEIGEGV